MALMGMFDLTETVAVGVRGEALKLTHSWQRGMSQAAAAYSSGNRAEAHRLATTARVIRFTPVLARMSESTHALVGFQAYPHR